MSGADDLTPSAPSRLRRTFCAVAGVIAVVGLVASIVAVWAHGVLFDSSKVAGAVDDALQVPEVTDSMAVYLTDQILLAIDADGTLADVLPADLDHLRPALVGGVRSLVADQMATLLQRDDVRGVVVSVVRRSHAALMRLLDGDGMIDGVSVADGEVTVNLLPLIARGLGAVQAVGLLEGVDVPTLSADGDPAEQRDDLSAALDRELPPGFGQLVVYRSAALNDADQLLATAQRAMAMVKRSIALVLVLTAGAFVACLLLATRRSRVALVLLLASAAVLVIVRAVINKIVTDAPTLVVEPGARAAIASTVNSLAGGLLTTVTLTALIGAVAAGALYLTRGASATVVGLARSHPDGAAFACFGTAVAAIALGGFGTVTVVTAAAFAVCGAAALRLSPAPSDSV